MEGLKLASIYGLKPHELGFCGPQVAAKQKILRGFVLGKISEKEAQAVLEKFEGAYQYYKLIAESNGIEDPFDEKVIRAYWVGNKLLDKVKVEDLRQMVIEKFSYAGLLPKEVAEEKAKAISEKAIPHHSLHVYVIGSVTGKVDLNDLVMKDLCRVSWGKVLEINEDKIIVEYRSIVGDKKIGWSELKRKVVDWDKNILPAVNIGDRISFHWKLAIQILSKEDIINLEKYTFQNISG